MTEVPRGEQDLRLQEDEAIARLVAFGAAEPEYGFDFDAIRDQARLVGSSLRPAAEGLLRRCPWYATVQEPDGSVVARGDVVPEAYERWTRDGDDAPAGFDLYLPLDNGLFVISCKRDEVSFSTQRSWDIGWTVDERLTSRDGEGISVYIPSIGARFTLDEEGIFWLKNDQGKYTFNPADFTPVEAAIAGRYTTLSVLQYRMWRAARDFSAATLDCT